ncbi:MAG TPA: hypothetical protein GXX42_15680 [Petrimonas sp.]|uniref:hypothetical protein n=1 Tax=Petrimonas sp. TaxID=2023866 RepID=UPI0017751E3B|nr:hypothetical protein [Petrimonas sp.]
MNILSQLNTLISPVLPVETGVFSGIPPDEYVVLTPLTDNFSVFGDDKPQLETQEARISLFSKKGYIKRKIQLVKLLLGADFVITDRRYIGYENSTGYHLYAIDVANYYKLEE